MSEMVVNDDAVIEGLEACFFDDDIVQNDVVRGKESTGKPCEKYSKHSTTASPVELQIKLVSRYL